MKEIAKVIAEVDGLRYNKELNPNGWHIEPLLWAMLIAEFRKFNNLLEEVKDK